MRFSIAHTAKAPAQPLGKMLKGVEGLDGDISLDKLRLFRGKLYLSKLGLGTRVTTSTIRAEIAKDLRRRGLPPEECHDIVKNAMDIFGDGGTVGRLRILGMIVSRGIGQTDRIEVALQGDANVRANIQKRFGEMFRVGLADFERIATAALGGRWNVDISKTDIDGEDMIQVAFSGRNNPEAQFEFFLDKANQRILCGHDFAARAAAGDPDLTQMTELLTDLVRYSKDHALDRAVFKTPSRFETYSLLRNGYGASSERQIYKFIVKMANTFSSNREEFAKAMGDKEAMKALVAIDKVVKKLLNSSGIEDENFGRTAGMTARVGKESRNILEDFMVTKSETNYRDVMKIVNIGFLVDLEILLKHLEDDPQFQPAVQGLRDQHEGGRVPLGRVLSNMVAWDGGYFDVVYVPTTDLPKVPPGSDAGQRRVGVRHPVNG